MARKMTMSIVGLYNYDNSIFDDMLLPTEPTGIDRQGVIDSILLECSGNEVLYPDWDMMKLAIRRWSENNIGIWKELWKTANYDYDVFENYNMTEEYTRTPDITRKSVNSGSDTSVSEVVPFNSNQLTQNAEATATLGTENTQTESGEEKYTKHTYGDASVRSAPQVIEEQRRAAQFSVQEFIVQSFREHLCLSVYSL